MNERDRKYDRMDGEQLYGRGELLDDVMHQLRESCTIFGFEGVSGVGKSQVAWRFATFASEGDARIPIYIDVSDQQSQDLLIARLYSDLREIPKTFSQNSDQLASAMLAKTTGVLRRVLAGAFQDAMKKVNEHLEHTMEAVASEITGEHSDGGTGALLADTTKSNQRYFIRDFMTFIADLGNPVILVFDNYEDAEPGAQDFLNWLIGAKPDHWVLVIVANVEKPTDTDWQTRMAPSIELEAGRMLRVDPLSRGVIAEWFEDVVKRMPTDEDVEHAIAASNQGRPIWLREYLASIAKGAAPRAAPALSALFISRRNAVDAAARSVAELMAFARPDAQIPREWVEVAAAQYGVAHVGSAIDALLARSEIVLRDGKLSFYNSSYCESWRDGLSKPELLKVQQVWYAFYRGSSDAMLSVPGAGILRELAFEIARHDDGSNITRVATGLIQSGNVNTALAIVDASWQAGSEMDSPGSDVIEHALVAAQARLDVGRYRDAHEALQMIARSSTRDKRQEALADLLGLKLALRQNAYALVWRLSSKLQTEAADDPQIQLSRELVVNTAYRDLCRTAEISASVTRIFEFVSKVSEGDRAKAERSLARSLAKLGRTDEALTVAGSALDLAEHDGDPREVANAKLAMAESLRYAGRLAEAIAAYREAESLARGIGNRDCEIWSVLGRACAHLQNGDLDAAQGALATGSKVVSAPGFEHPLESAHVAMIDLILNALRGRSVDPAGTLMMYHDIGIEWPDAYIDEVASSHRIAEPIPI